MTMSSRNVAIGLIGAVAFIIIAFLFVSREGGDKGLFKNFYGDIMKKTKSIDDTFKPFSDAMDQQKWVEAVKIGKASLPAVSKGVSDLEGMKVPDLKDDKVGKDLQEAKKLITEAYRNKVNIINNYLDFARDPKTAAEKELAIKDNIEGFKKTYFEGMEKLLSVGQALKVSPEELEKALK